MNQIPLSGQVDKSVNRKKNVDSFETAIRGSYGEAIVQFLLVPSVFTFLFPLSSGSAFPLSASRQPSDWIAFK